MKKVICFVVAMVLLLCGCAPANRAEESTAPTKTMETTISTDTTEGAVADQTEADALFIIDENRNLISPSGEEYVFLAGEWELRSIGEWEYVGGVQGEEETSQHFMYSYKTGMYAINGDDSHNVLIRKSADNEWCLIYRKSSLPEFDFSSDNCIRLEYVPGSSHFTDKDGIHTTCGGGIVNKWKVASFFWRMKWQRDILQSRKYDYFRNADGTMTYYHCGTIYGFFEEEPNLVLEIKVFSFDAPGYAVMIDGVFYELPELWVQRFEETVCNCNIEP